MSDLPEGQKKEKGRPRKGSYAKKRDGYLPDIHRSLPQSLDAEKGVLCSCLLSPGTVLDECATRLLPEAFYHPAHQLLYEEMIEMRSALVPVDFITLTSRLKKRGLPDNATEEQMKAHAGLLDKVGGAASISELFTFVPTASNADYYIDIVREKYHLRQLIRICTEFGARAYEEQGEVKVLLDEFEQRAMNLGAADGSDEADILDTRQVMELMMNQVEARYKRRGHTIGIPSGFADLDRMLQGFMDEEFYLLAARPSQGKSAAAVNMIRHIIEHANGYKAGLFSLEMPAADQANRLISDVEGIELQKFRDGFFSDMDVKKIVRAAGRYAKENRFHIDQTPALSIQSFRAKARRMVRRGVNIIFVDYLQLAKSTSKRAQDNRQAEVAEISAALKASARELKIPIVALAQLTRDAENRKPNLAMLRESGALEQDADAVIFVFRPQKGEKDERTGKPLEVEDAEFIVAKQRNGPVGDVELTFTGKFTRFKGKTEKLTSNNPAERQGYIPPAEPDYTQSEDADD